MTPAACGSALLRAILEAPADDLARLAYADWLEEGGEAERAELIRDQVQFRPGSADFDLLDANLEAWCPWFARHDELGFRRCRERLGAAVVRHQGGETTHWDRGFVCSVALPCDAFLAHAEALFGAHPITELRLTDKEPRRYHNNGGGDLFGWYCGSHPDSDRVSLPPELWPAEHWPQATRFHGPWRDFGSERLALAALSRACVTWARGLHNLPPLEENGR